MQWLRGLWMEKSLMYAHTCMLLFSKRKVNVKCFSCFQYLIFCLIFTRATPTIASVPVWQRVELLLPLCIMHSCPHSPILDTAPCTQWQNWVLVLWVLCSLLPVTRLSIPITVKLHIKFLRPQISHILAIVFFIPSLKYCQQSLTNSWGTIGYYLRGLVMDPGCCVMLVDCPFISVFVCKVASLIDAISYGCCKDSMIKYKLRTGVASSMNSVSVE